MPVILATREAEIGGSTCTHKFETSLGNIVKHHNNNKTKPNKMNH
jgi:hypothetical protein